MKHENEELGVSFELPDSVTVREQLGFRERVFIIGEQDTYSRYWAGVIPLLDNWQCELIPDPEAVDLDTETDVQIANIINWVANTAAGHFASLEEPDPN
jgi:hypothetical protein